MLYFVQQFGVDWLQTAEYRPKFCIFYNIDPPNAFHFPILLYKLQHSSDTPTESACNRRDAFDGHSGGPLVTGKMHSTVTPTESACNRQDAFDGHANGVRLYPASLYTSIRRIRGCPNGVPWESAR